MAHSWCLSLDFYACDSPTWLEGGVFAYYLPISEHDLCLVHSRCLWASPWLGAQHNQYCTPERKRVDRNLILWPGIAVKGRRYWNFFFGGYGIDYISIPIQGFPVPTPLVMRLWRALQSRGRVCFPTPWIWAALWPTLTRRLRQKWWYTGSDPGLKRPCQIVLILLESWPATMWISPSQSAGGWEI